MKYCSVNYSHVVKYLQKLKNNKEINTKYYDNNKF